MEVKFKNYGRNFKKFLTKIFKNLENNFKKFLKNF